MDLCWCDESEAWATFTLTCVGRRPAFVFVLCLITVNPILTRKKLWIYLDCAKYAESIRSAFTSLPKPCRRIACTGFTMFLCLHWTMELRTAPFRQDLLKAKRFQRLFLELSKELPVDLPQTLPNSIHMQQWLRRSVLILASFPELKLTVASYSIPTGRMRLMNGYLFRLPINQRG